MATQTNNPNGDVSNKGWTFAGGLTTLNAVLSSVVDTNYIISPASRGGATVKFPQDVSIPAGAKITSVSITLRASSGGTPPVDSDDPVTVTVDTITSDDTSRFLSRTIPLTSTITTYTVATYTRDAKGRAWDIHSLNKALLRVSSATHTADAVRVMELYIVINYKAAPTITVDAPTGTVTTPSPVISWTYTQVDGDVQDSYRIRVFTGAQAAVTGFDPGASTAVFDQDKEGDVQSITLPTSLNPDIYWAYVQAESLFEVESAWVGRQFVVAGSSPGVPGAPGNSAGIGGAGVLSVIADDNAGNATILVSDTSNLQSVQAAGFYNTVDGTEFFTTNCTMTQDTSAAFLPNEVGSWALTPAANGDASAQSFWLEVSPNQQFTERFQVLARTATKNCQVIARFADSTFTTIGGADITGTTVASSTSTWVEPVVTGTIPATAAYMCIIIKVLSATTGQVHNIDHIGSMYGKNSPYSDGGQASRNMLSSYYAIAEDPQPSGQAWVGASGTTADRTAITGIGNKTHRMTYNGVTPTLALRATSTAFNSATTGSDYTLNKPTGTATGDLLVAYVAASYPTGIQPPAGWTLVNGPTATSSSGSTALYILKRTAGGSEPSTWTDGFLQGTAARRYAVVVAYSGAADASQQFIADAAASSALGTPLYLTTPSVNSTDSNAWRLSAFVVSDNVTGGSMVSNKTAPTIPAITYVGSATPWKTISDSTSYTINRPTGVVSGDLMIAVVGYTGSGSVNTPSGWTAKGSTTDSDGRCTGAVFIRTAGGSEPSSWSSSVNPSSTTSGCKVVQCVAYRGADTSANQFVVSAINSAHQASTIQTSNVNNTNSGAWRVTAYMADGDPLSSWSPLDPVKRVDSSIFSSVGSYDNDDSMTVAIADSNGSASTGWYNSSATLSPQAFFGAVGFICFIKPLGTPITPGGNDTQRAFATTGASDPWLSVGVYDSNGAAGSGTMSATGTFTPSSGSSVESMVGWVGLLKPGGYQPVGLAQVSMQSPVLLSLVDPAVIALAGNNVTVTAQFAGATTTGTPYLTANFYRANVLLSSATAAGSSYQVYGTWTKSAATFPMPDGTTRIGVTLGVDGRAVSDAIYFNKVGLSFGSSSAWRNGTGQAVQPIWAVPEIQFADDKGLGFSDWAALPGSVNLRPPAYDYLSGSASYTDDTIIPLTVRKYRARTKTYGLNGDVFVSAWSGQSSAVSFQASNWWLKDIANPQNNLALKVKWVDLGVPTTGTGISFQPLGQDFPVVVTEGYKGDTIKLDLRPVNQLDWAKLSALLRSGRSLFLQSDIDLAWWVRPIGNLDTDVLATNMRQSNPLRDVTVTFLQVAPEE